MSANGFDEPFVPPLTGWRRVSAWLIAVIGSWALLIGLIDILVWLVGAMRP